MDDTPIDLADMKRGDVLLLDDVSESTHQWIARGQSIFNWHSKGSNSVTHAGLYSGGDHNILESAGSAGLRSMDICTKHPGYRFRVYRLQDTFAYLLANAAAKKAEELIEQRPDDLKNAENSGVGFGRYGKSNAAFGLISFSNRGKGAKAAVSTLVETPGADRAFYCSNFVVECYELACHDLRVQHVIDVDYRKVSPKMLQAVFEKNNSGWRQMGVYTV
jgi:hypothetical protein